MADYLIGTVQINSMDSGFESALAGAYVEKIRPFCLCISPNPQMYLAKVNSKVHIKRMPNTGETHAPGCDSYDAPAELSGLGEVIGSAIQENPEEGTTALRFNFSLSKGAGRAAPAPSGEESDSVKTDGNKLTMRGTLHYLWEQAGFNRWAPGMAGKRTWSVIRHYLLQAAEDKTAKGTSLADLLYIPEPFNLDRKKEITHRRMAHMMKIASTQSGTRRLMMVVGEVKEIAQARYGHKIILKHLPDFHFMLNDELHKRLNKRFIVELGLWDAIDSSHLMIIGTFGIGVTGVASLEEVALMCVAENWIPFENQPEKMLLDTLSENKRRFSKGLRYNLPSSRPLAFAVLTDTQPKPTALYVVPPGASDQYETALNELVAESNLASWIWKSGEDMLPSLPEQHR
ncbi:DUF1173 domain-containing protein [Chromobacterium vaccinii]|uniref:DUF1173 domain-containing protein n=1 Tax=Chromobacterium vaccinii TaxID=1108595 RepID=UPI00345AC528